jgi:hypothetical protein
MKESIMEKRAIKAARELSAMTEEERRMLAMAPDEKKFFLAYKNKNPQNPWNYFADYQTKLQREYKLKQKELA